MPNPDLRLEDVLTELQVKYAEPAVVLDAETEAKGRYLLKLSRIWERRKFRVILASCGGWRTS